MTLPTAVSEPPAIPLDRVAALEDLTLTAWPCLRTIHHDGWVLRFARGHTGRANSVNVLAPGVLALKEKVAFAEQRYRDQSLDPMFRLTPLCPPELDGELERQGYALDNPSLVQVLDGLPPAGPDLPGVRVESRPSPEWIDAYAGMTGLSATRRSALAAILDAIAPATLYAAAVEDGEIRSVALGVVDRAHVGIFDVATRRDCRGQGLAGRVVGTLLRRAAGLGAASAYLQVAAPNAPALAVYGRLGFRTLYPYHYRRKAL